MSTEIDTTASADLPEWLQLVWRQVGSLRYGAVEIVVHDSRVTQLEKVERVRLDRPEPSGSSQAHA